MKLNEYVMLYTHYSPDVLVNKQNFASVGFVFRPHRMHGIDMRPIATDDTRIAWSVCLCVGHTDVLCKNG